jgi:large repetitive protein
VRRRRVLLPFAGIACAALLAVSGSARMSAAAFTSNLTIAGNGVTVDRLSNHFEVIPGPPASGDVDSLDVDLGLVASPGSTTGVFTVENVSAQTRTATLSLQSPAQVASIVFEASGTASVTLAPGASSSVAVTTSLTVAGRGTGTFRLALGGSTWLYRDYTIALDAAPVAPGSLSATARAGGDVALAWTPSATTTNLAGYDVYRSAGGPYTKLNGSPIAGTTFTDATGAEGTAYTYKVRAVSSGAVALDSTDSPPASATPDATAPILPSAVQLVNGGGQGNQYVNLANRASVSISVTLPATSVASDVVRVTLRNGAQSVSKTAPATAGVGTVTVGGLDMTSLADGTITIEATVADAAGNVSAPRASSAPKDTVAPGLPTATYVDQRNQADQITGTAESGAAISALQTAPSSSGPYTGTAGGTGAYTLAVANTGGKKNQPITVTYVVTATDAAGNTGPGRTLTADDTM